MDLIEVIIDGNPTPGRLSTVALVFEYLDHDLSGLLDTPEAASQITPALAKSYMVQLVAGVSGKKDGREAEFIYLFFFSVSSAPPRRYEGDHDKRSASCAELSEGVGLLVSF